MKIDIKLGEFQVCLEGDNETVIDVFHDIRTNGLGTISKNNHSLISEQQQKQTFFDYPEQGVIDLVENDYSRNTYVRDILVKDILKNQSELVLVVAYSIAGYKNLAFNSPSILDEYRKLNIYDDNKSKHLSREIKKLISNGYIKSVNNTDYIVTEKGKDLYKEIIIRNPKDVKKNNKTANNGGKKSSSSIKDYSLIDLGMSSEERTTLKERFVEAEVTTQKDQVLYSIYLYQELTGVELFNYNLIYSILKSVGTKIPRTLNQVAINCKNDDLLHKVDDKYKLTHIGEDYIKEEILGLG